MGAERRVDVVPVLTRMLLAAMGVLLLAGCVLPRGPLPPPAAPRLAPRLSNTATPAAEVILPTVTADAAPVAPLPPSTLAVTATVAAPASTPVAATTLAPQIIGGSALGHPLEVYRFGAGPDRIVFVSGIHGGYEWNTVLLAYAVIDYLAAHPESIPANVTVEIIPAANPDGVVEVVGRPGRFTVDEIAADTRPGRFNGNGVDLNRNWECRWSPVGLWGKTEVSGGSAPHSEPETQALIAFLRHPEVKAAIFWHSAVPGVFAGGCEATFEPGVALAQVYAAASGYPYQASFTSYTVTGDAVDWLAAQGLPAIEVELRAHDALEWEQNLAGVLAVLAYYGAGEP
jgi:predicted deacylase